MFNYTSPFQRYKFVMAKSTLDGVPRLRPHLLYRSGVYVQNINAFAGHVCPRLILALLPIECQVFLMLYPGQCCGYCLPVQLEPNIDIRCND